MSHSFNFKTYTYNNLKNGIGKAYSKVFTPGQVDDDEPQTQMTHINMNNNILLIFLLTLWISGQFSLHLKIKHTYLSNTKYINGMTLNEHMACSLSQKVMTLTNTCNHTRSQTNTPISFLEAKCMYTEGWNGKGQQTKKTFERDKGRGNCMIGREIRFKKYAPWKALTPNNKSQICLVVL